MKKEQEKMINEEIRKNFNYIIKYEIKSMNGTITEHYTILEKMLDQEKVALPIVQYRESTEGLEMMNVIVDMEDYNRERNELIMKDSGSEIRKGIKCHIRVKLSDGTTTIVETPSETPLQTPRE